MFIILARSSTIMGLTLEYSALNVYICQCSLLYNDAALAVSWIAQLTSFFFGFVTPWQLSVQKLAVTKLSLLAEFPTTLLNDVVDDDDKDEQLTVPRSIMARKFTFAWPWCGQTKAKMNE